MVTRSHRQASQLGALVLIVGILFSREAYVARHADYVKRTLVLSGPVAREIVSLLGLKADRPATLVLELPEGMEHFEAMAMKRAGQQASMSSQEPSRRLSLSVSWDPRRDELSLGEHWYDQSTAFPHAAGPRYLAGSPQFKDDAGATRAWSPVYRALRGPGAVTRTTKDFSISSELRLRLELIPWNGKVALYLSVGPWIEDSGGSRGRE